MKILLFGANGQVGFELKKSLSTLGQVVALGREQADLNKLDHLQETIRNVSPNVIVNAAAYTAVDKAEDNISAVHKINADAVKIMALEAKRLNAWLIHYSTDYVFNGLQSSPYIETAETKPINVYGWTKLQGEEFVKQTDCLHLILRTSWVYSLRQNNFAKTILRLANDKEEINIVDDQIGVPTSAEFIAETTSHCLNQLLQQEAHNSKASGIYHLTPNGRTSWYDFACFLIQEAEQLDLSLKLKSANIHPIPSTEYPTPAKRPSYSLLDNSKIQKVFDLEFPDWTHHAKKFIFNFKQLETA